ncbi:MAG: hypothetical protein WA802_17935 [Terracidiphilus sp.]
MNLLPSAFGAHNPIARLLILIAGICMATAATRAQDPAAGQTGSTAANQPPAGTAAEPAKPNPDSEWLAKTAKLYYSSAKAGLTGFDCAIHPDWHTLFVSANMGKDMPEDDPRIALLNSVKITMHARMRGISTIDWVADSNPDKPTDQSSADLLDSMHKAVEERLEGFLQFWGPFMEASVVPDSDEGLEITHTPTVHTIRAKQGGTELREIFSSELVLEEFDVNLSGTSIKFTPLYEPTPQGLLVNAFEARILPAGTPSAQEQVMKVGIEYQPVGGFTIPGKLKMDLAGAGIFKFAFDGCTTNPK